MRKLSTSVPGVYTITCMPTGKIYVGQARNVTKRWQSHRWHLRKQKHGNHHLQRAWTKYGEGSFAFDFVAQPVGEVGEGLLWLETTILSQHPDNFNLMQETGPRLQASAETRAKLSAERKARWADPEYRARLSAAHKARHQDPDYSSRRAASIKAALSTDEAKAHRSKLMTEYWDSEEARRQQGERQKELWSDPEYRATQHASRKETWADPAKAARRKAGLKRAWNELSPEDRAARIAAASSHMRTPEGNARRSELSKAIWTPERRAAVSAKRRALAAQKKAAKENPPE